MAHNPLEFLYEQFTAYIEERRREPRDDVMTGMATATFPDGSTPEAIDVARIAANLFAAGQETTVRLFGTALQRIGDDHELQQLLRERPRPHPELRRGVPAHREPGEGRLPARARDDGARRRRRSPPAPR